MSVAVPPRKRAQKKKTALIVGASVVAVAVVAVLLASLADSGNSTKTPKKKASTTTPAASTTLTLRLGAIHTQNTGLPTKVKPAVRAALVKIAQGYVDNAIMAPLEKGAVNNAYATSFDPGVKRAAARNDRAVLTEVRTGAATGPITATASPVRIDAVGDQTGKIALAATTFTLQIKAPTSRGVLTIRRRTELTFANEFGRWYVTAYRVIVRRSRGNTTSSAASTSSPNGTTT